MKPIGVAVGLVLLPFIALSPGRLGAQAPSPDAYDVQISYRINAFRNERLSQYYEMMRVLKKIGFVRDPNEEVPETEPEDTTRTRMSGTIPARRVPDLLNERHIRSILLMPHGAKLPEDKAKRVRVEVELYDSLTPEEQYRLNRQTFEVLAGLSFFEAVGYDHRGYTRLVGSMPLERVDTLLTDLRQQPAGKKLPSPFRNVWAVRATRMNPDVPPPAPRLSPPRVTKGQEKLSPDLRDLLNDAAAAEKPTRLEVILAETPNAEDKSCLRMLRRAVPGLMVEGRLGPLVTIVVPPSRTPALTALPAVIGLRLPRLPQPERPSSPIDKTRWQPLLDASGAARLQAMGNKGQGTRLAVVDSDFRGWKELVGKGLPAQTRLFDLTAERNIDLLPDPFPAGDGPGNGTRRALTIVRLAPEIKLDLIRVAPDAPYMIEAAARAINGDSAPSIALDARLSELNADEFLLDKRREQLAEERRLVFASFATLGERHQRLLKQVQEQNLSSEQVEKLPTFQTFDERDRAAILYRIRQSIYDRDARAFHDRQLRYVRFKRDMPALRGIRVVASSLSWNDGYPVDGTSALSRYFDDRPFRAALWFQASGDTRGQSWTGLFRDADANGVLEFADPRQPLPPERWSHELNFLSWQGPNGRSVDDIPAGTRLRISLQWREAHDPLYAQTGEDPYRQPLARTLRIFLLRQLDPTGTRQPCDDMEMVAQSADIGQRLSAAPNSATYEITLDVQIKQAGRYALRIGGRASDSIYPPGDPTLPALRKHTDTWLRLFVSPLDASGRVVFRDFVTASGSVGMPADARTPVTVGAADARNRRQPSSGGGAPLGMQLLSKPDVLAYDGDEGTGQAAAFAAGLTALVPQAGHTPAAFLQNLHIPPGGVLRLPSPAEMQP